MKKTISLLIAIVLAILLVGCAKNEEVSKYDKTPITADAFYMRYSTSSGYQVTSNDYGYLSGIINNTPCYKASSDKIILWFYEFSSEDEAESKYEAFMSRKYDWDTSQVYFETYDISIDENHYQFSESSVWYKYEGGGTSKADSYAIRVDNTMLIAHANYQQEQVTGGIRIIPQAGKYLEDEYEEANEKLEEEITDLGYWPD